MIKEAVWIQMCGSPETASGKCYRKIPWIPSHLGPDDDSF